MNDQPIQLCDYAVAFIDLLGQKAEMPDRHLPSEQDEALALVKRSVGKIIGTQNLFEKFYKGFSANEGLYSRLTEELQSTIPHMAPGELKRQVFSDGLVIYVPLGNGLVRSPVNSLFGLLMASGVLCAAGLAAKGPLRIGIDVAWAVEYRPGELYGSAVAHAYHLESKVAQWPRVVVGKGLMGYLKHYSESRGEDTTSQFRRKMAGVCQELVSEDIDSNLIVDYLGNGFKNAAPAGIGEDLASRAREFIDEQLNKWERANVPKLSERYKIAQEYYERHGISANSNNA